MTAETTPRRPVTGRLSAARERAILDVALALLADVGYDRMSVDEVARRARASKATLYRRWPGKADLAAAALLSHKVDRPAPALADTLRADLTAAVASICADAAATRDLTLGLLTAMHADPYLAHLIKPRLLEFLRQDMASLLDRAVARGDLPPDTVDPAAVTEVVQSLVYNRLLLTGAPLDDAFGARLVDAILLPILHAAGRTPDPD